MQGGLVPPDLGRSLQGSVSRRVLLLFLAAACLILVLAAALTIRLSSDALQRRLRREVEQTARLLGAGGAPLNDPALVRIADYIGADLAVVDGRGRLVAASVEADRRAALARALEAGGLPPVGDRARLREARLEGAAYTVGVAPFGGAGAAITTSPGGPAGRAGLYVLYPEPLITQQARAVWLPMAAVAVLAASAALGLGALSQRALQRAHAAAFFRLLFSLAHEVKNPLAAIRALARSLRPDDGDAREGDPAALIEAEAERLTILVDGLCGLGRTLEPATATLPADDALRGVLALLAHQLDHRRIRREVLLRAEGLQVRAEPTHLQTVALNLLLNAADAMPRGGTLRVTSDREETAEGPRLRLVVADSGPGVDPAVRGRLFTPFATTKKGGLGLGLYTSRRLVEAQGGTIALEPGQGPGARFVVTWPAAVEADQPRPAAAEER